MSPGSRCDEVIRLIDEALGDDAPSEPAPSPHSVDSRDLDLEEGVEELPGHWGVYYLRPSA